MLVKTVERIMGNFKSLLIIHKEMRYNIRGRWHMVNPQEEETEE
jgi:hypothetical protein